MISREVIDDRGEGKVKGERGANEEVRELVERYRMKRRGSRGERG